MTNDNKPNPANSKLITYISVGVAVGMVGSVYASMVPLVPDFVDMYQFLKQKRYALAHLDSQAIDSREQSFQNGYINYEDSDNDGYYESYLDRKNTDGEFAKITMQRDLEGKIEFTNLSETAINPLQIPEQPYGMKIDYIDLDCDGTLESVTYLGSKDELQSLQIEFVSGDYVLSNI